MFVNLEVLECNQIEEFNLSTISQFIAGELGRLTELHCKTTNFEKTSYIPGSPQLEFLNCFYNSLKRMPDAGGAQGSFYVRELRAGLAIHLNGVELNLKMEFSKYHFERLLIEMHRHNELVNHLKVKPCPTVFKTDYVEAAQRFQDPNGNLQFITRYPNIRIIRFFLLTETQRSDLQNGSFLQHLRGLLVLEFKRSAIGQAFYDRLVQMPCSRSLTHLTILESDSFLVRINFEFLTRLKNLHQFETNAAPRDLMLDCLTMMTPRPTTQRFVFRFENQRIRTSRIFIFYRFSRELWLKSETSTQTRGSRERVHWNRLAINQMQWDDLVGHFNHPRNANLTAHRIRTDPAHQQRNPNEDSSSGVSSEESG